MHRELAPIGERFQLSPTESHDSTYRESTLRLTHPVIQDLKQTNLTKFLNTADILCGIFNCLFISCIALHF